MLLGIGTKSIRNPNPRSALVSLFLRRSDMPGAIIALSQTECALLFGKVNRQVQLEMSEATSPFHPTEFFPESFGCRTGGGEREAMHHRYFLSLSLSLLFLSAKLC